MSEKILYLECSSGISGDMTVAALLDLGASRQILEDSLSSLPLEGYSVEIKDVYKSGIRACDFNVILAQDNHDHDMNYLHGSGSAESHVHDDSGSDGSHVHEAPGSDEPHVHEAPGSAGSHVHEGSGSDEPHVHDGSGSADIHSGHGHTHHHHDARNLADIIDIINAGHLTEGARRLAIRIFRILAKAEASVHGKSIDEIHFHEVGAVDSIVDIVSAAICLDQLQPDKIIVSPLTDGHGQIRCQHGLIPVPVPAVTAIAANEGLVLKASSVEGELVTPTGAAIAAAVSSGCRLPEEYRILRTGHGAGKRDYAATGLLRAMLLESASDDMHDVILSLETNIDDCTGEALSYTMKALMDAGALDVFYIPIYMKKNRPAYLLKVLCQKEQRQDMEAIIFRNTTTIGIRIQELRRTKLPRNIQAVETPWGMADIKCCTYGDDTYYYPENDSVAALARKEGIGFPDMYSRIQAYAREHGAPALQNS